MMSKITLNPDDAYTAAREHAALFDLSSLGKVLLTGPDAPQFVHNLCTNTVTDLALGAGCPAYLCDPRAKVLFPLWIYHLRLRDGRHALWLETAAGCAQDLLTYLDRYRISEQVEMSNVTVRFAQFHLAGPQATALLATAIADAVPTLPAWGHMERTIGTLTVHIRRFDRLGLPGYDIVVLAERGAQLRDHLLNLGIIPGTSSAYETLRIEAGFPLCGVDYDRERSVLELPHFEQAVSYTKGCFPGQEPIVMARDRTGHPVRTFVGLKVLHGGPPMPGTRLLQQQREVGILTSSTFSPRLQAPLALGYLRWGIHTPGQIVEIEPGAGARPALVLGPPPFDLTHTAR
jgi:folate-binding protein YgfZ